MKLIISMAKALSVLISNFMCINTFVKIQTLTKLFIIHNIQCSIRNAILTSWFTLEYFLILHTEVMSFCARNYLSNRKLHDTELYCQLD
jgi:hypothetical protein